MPAQHFCPTCHLQFANDLARQVHRIGRRCLSADQLRARGWLQPTGRAWHLPDFNKFNKKEKPHAVD